MAICGVLNQRLRVTELRMRVTRLFKSSEFCSA